MPYSAHAIVESIIKKLGCSDLVTLVERGLRYGEKSGKKSVEKAGKTSAEKSGETSAEKSGKNSGKKTGKKSSQKFVKKSSKTSGEKFDILPHFLSLYNHNTEKFL